MKTSEIKKKSVRDLRKLLNEKREKQRELRFDLIADKLKNYREIRKVKKEVAQILTALRNTKEI